MEDEKGIRCGVRPNAVAAPATVGGKQPCRRPLGSTGKAKGLRWIREPGDLPSSERPRAVRDATATVIARALPTLRPDQAASRVLARRHAAPCGGTWVSQIARPRLFICTTCRARRTLADDEPRPGAQLHSELERLLGPFTGAAPVELRDVACLANCERGCSGAIAMPGKWTYLLGFLSAEHAADLLIYGAAYGSSTNGTVLPSRRPASLQNAVIGRVPPTELLA